jgi:hypothetical protein
MPSGNGSHGGRRPGAGRPRGAVSRRNGLFRVSLGSLARRYGEEAIRTLVTVMSDKHAPGMARLNAVVELSNRGYGRPPQQPIEGLTPQLPENPTEDEIVEHYVRSGLAPLFASALDQMKADIVTTPAARPEGQHRSHKRDARNRAHNKNTKRSTAK